MTNICLYFQVHQPFRLSHYPVSAIGRHRPYFDDALNREVFLSISERCYRPAAEFFLTQLDRHPGLRLAFSFSGVWLEQCAQFDPALLELYRVLVARDAVEVLAETSHHSLAALADRAEFLSQVREHRAQVERVLGCKPTTFRNTELIYSDDIGALAAEAGLSACLLEGWEKAGVIPGQVFSHPQHPNLALIPRNHTWSDAIGFQFSSPRWPTGRLTAHDFHAHTLQSGDLCGVFLDLETLGEHLRAESGIFDFFDSWFSCAARDSRVRFVTPAEIACDNGSRPPLSCPEPISWADVARDVSAWLGNDMQRDAFARAYSLGEKIRSASPELLSDWRRLLTSDHLYYMCTKGNGDGIVHAHFRPYPTPFEAYFNFMNVVEDLELRL